MILPLSGCEGLPLAPLLCLGRYRVSLVEAQGVAYGEALVASKDERGWESGVGDGKLNQNALASEAGLMRTPCGD